jgi:hypothetical protein
MPRGGGVIMANNHSVVKRHRRCKSGKREKQERERIFRTVKGLQYRAALAEVDWTALWRVCRSDLYGLPESKLFA